MKESDFSALTYILTDMTKGELQEAAAFFGVNLRPSDRKAVMVKRLETAYRTDMLRCLKRLPIYELRNLQLLVAQGKGVKMLIPEPLPPFFSYMFGLLEDDYLPENDDLNSDWDDLMRIYFEDEVFDLVAPVIDTAVKEVEDSGRVEYERFLWGCLTIYGYLTVSDFVNLWRSYYPDWDQASVFKFLESYAPFPYLTDENGGYLMYMDLDLREVIAEQKAKRTFGWEPARVSLEDIISAGKTTPYNFPYVSHPEGRALVDALKAVGHGGDAGAFRMHQVWLEKQFGSGNNSSFKDLIQRILNDVRVDSFEAVQKLVGAITDYSNAIPAWVFRGRSSNDLMKEERPFLKPLPSGPKTTLTSLQETLPGFGSVPRVGRNDPCPCGSGLKYKNCHGRWES